MTAEIRVTHDELATPVVTVHAQVDRMLRVLVQKEVIAPFTYPPELQVLQGMRPVHIPTDVLSTLTHAKVLHIRQELIQRGIATAEELPLDS